MEDCFLSRLDGVLRPFGFIRKDNKYIVNGTDKDSKKSTDFFWDVDFEKGLPIVRPMKFVGDYIIPVDVGSSIGLSQSRGVVECLVSEFIKDKNLKDLKEMKDKEPVKAEVKDGVAAVEMGESTDENNRDKRGVSPPNPAPNQVTKEQEDKLLVILKNSEEKIGRLLTEKQVLERQKQEVEDKLRCVDCQINTQTTFKQMIQALREQKEDKG